MSNTPRYRIYHFFFVLLDAVGIYLAFHIAYWLRFAEYPPSLAFNEEVIVIWLLAAIAHYAFSLNFFEFHSQSFDVYQRFIVLYTFWSLAVFAFLYLFARHKDLTGRGVIFIALGLFMVWSLWFRLVVNRIRTRLHEEKSWLFLGSQDYLEALRDDLEGSRFYRKGLFMDVSSGQLCFLDPQKPMPSDKWGEAPSLDALIQANLYGVVVCRESQLSSALWDALVPYRLRGYKVYDLLDFYETWLFRVPVFHLTSGWLALEQGFSLQHNPTGFRLKRLVDLASVMILSALAFPLMLLVALAVAVESPGGAIYQQIRVGANGRRFQIYKFRSMRQDAEAKGAQWSSNGDSRITRVGRFIRITRLDELPQLYNILKGEMSFVGPRPERPEFNVTLEQEIPYYDFRHLIKPGVTGWAQVNYPYGACVRDSFKKLQFDLFYIKNYSLFLDVVIIMKTVKVVLLGKGR